MTIVDMLAIYRGWRKSPPTHRLAAWWAGYKPPAEPVQIMTPEAARDFMARTGGRIPGIMRM